jgi:two-component system, NarL family, response regulator NreC
VCPPRTNVREIIFSERKIRCLIAHNHVLLRQGLRRLFEDEPDIDVVSEAGNAAECLRKLYEFRPDVLVADAGTFDLPAPEVALLVARESPRTKIVFLSREQQGISPFAGFEAAMGGCAVEQTSAEELAEMVRNSCGGMATNPIQANDIPTHQPEAPSRRAPQRSNEIEFPQEHVLTAREREVLKLLAEGKTVRVAATVLGVSSKTVDAHKFNLMRKLGIHNKAELVMWAIQKKVVKIPANF